MAVDNNVIKQLLDVFGKQKDVAALFDGAVPDTVALQQLKPILIALRRKGMTPQEIVEWLQNKTGINATARKIASIAPLPRRKKSTTATTAKKSDDAASAVNDNDAKSDAGTDDKAVIVEPAKLTRPEPVRLEDVQEWREAEGIVILKTTTALKPKTRIYTESGKVAEVTICKPTQYGGRFDKHDGMEVSFVLEKE